jgi:hypothetical protein
MGKNKPTKPPSSPDKSILLIDNKVRILLGITALVSAILTAVITGIFGNGILMAQLLATETPTLTPTLTVTPSPTVLNPFLEVTAIFQETQRAEQRNTAVAQLTQASGATATQQYVAILQTVQVEIESTRIYEQAQQQVATEQAQNAMATAQSIVLVQQTATAVANQQSVGEISSLYNRLSEFPVTLSDTFDIDHNGWSAEKGLGYDVKMQNGSFQMSFSEQKYIPFLWTCDACGTFQKFSYQVDIQTPKDIKGVVTGIVFGSPTRIDQQPFQEAYALSLYSTGAVILQRISALGMETVQLWDKRQDLLTPDGKFHTLQVVVIDKFALVYVDGKVVGDVISLEYPAKGYVGLVLQTTDVNIVYDNLKVVELP